MPIHYAFLGVSFGFGFPLLDAILHEIVPTLCEVPLGMFSGARPLALHEMQVNELDIVSLFLVFPQCLATNKSRHAGLATLDKG